MAEYKTFPQRIGFHWTCVALASILSDDIQVDAELGDGEEVVSLREEASDEGICFLRIVRYLPHANLYEGLVAKSEALLATAPVTAFFTEDQLYYTLPFDIRLRTILLKDTFFERKSGSEHVIERIEAHARVIRPMLHRNGSTIVQSQTLDLMATPYLVPEKFFVSAKSVDDHLETLCQQDSDTTAEQREYCIQQAFLLAAVDVIMTRLYSMQDMARVAIVGPWCALVATAQRWHRENRQNLVRATPLSKHLWSLQISSPVPLLVA